MQTIGTIVEEKRQAYPVITHTNFFAYLARLFGCWHRDMSRPFTHNRENYRVCLDCGAHRRFDLNRWEMCGPYYFNLAEATYKDMQKASVRSATDSRPTLKRLTLECGTHFTAQAQRS